MAKHYYIDNMGIGLGSGEIFPSNNPEAVQRKIEGTQVWREEVDEIKIPRTTNEKIYDRLHSWFIDKSRFDNEIEVKIYEGTKTTGVLYWEGLFSVSDTKDNFENTVGVLSPLRIDDEYRTILEQADRQIELDAGPRDILEQKRIGYSEVVDLPSLWTQGTPGISTGFSTWLTGGAGVILTAIATGATYQNAAYLSIPTLQNNDIFIIDVSSYDLISGSDPEIALYYGGGSDISMTDEAPKSIATGIIAYTISTGQSSPRLTINTRTTPFGAATFNATFTTRKIQADNDKTLAGELLMSFLDNFISDSSYMGVTSFSGNVVSTFIDNDALPTGAPSSISTFMAANPGGNYVTETTDNELNTTIIGLLREWFDVTQSSFKLSFNDIMGQLRNVLQVYWFIDADGKFRLEHEKYFVKQVDDSTAIVLDAQDEVDAREMVYNKTGIGSTETFQWAQATNQDFVGEDIIYNNFETTNLSVENSANYITTDIKYVTENIDDASSSGLALYQCNLVSGLTGGVDLYELNIATGALSSSLVSNAEFSWANLHEKYWSWSRMSENATINSVATTMQSSIRFLEQANVRFFYSTAIDPYTKITSILTSGAPKEIRRSLETDFVQILIGYDPYKL